MTTTITKEAIKHAKEIQPTEGEEQSLLIFTMETFMDNIRLEYMAFTSENNIPYSWGSILM